MIGRYDARPHASAIAPAAGGSGDRVVDRRAFIGTLTGSLLAAPLAVEGQQAGPVARIGFLGATSPSSWASRVEAFRSSPARLAMPIGLPRDTARTATLSMGILEARHVAARGCSTAAG